MPATMTAPERSEEVRSRERLGRALDHVRPTMAKAVRSSDQALCQVMREAIVDYYGSVQEAAFHLGEVDPSLMQREFKDGKFKRFDEHADAAAKAHVGEAVRKAFPPADPRAEAMRLLRELRARIDELAEVI